MQKYMFFSATSDIWKLPKTELAPGYYIQTWTPKVFSLAPKGLITPTFTVWWLFYWLRVFKNINYKIYLVYTKDNLLVHYAVLLPAHFRFPFMRDNDLQIGPIVTNKNHRRQGLAQHVLRCILKEFENNDTRLWYITREENDASIKLIEKVNFEKIGKGEKRINRYTRLFSFFNIDNKDRNNK